MGYLSSTTSEGKRSSSFGQLSHGKWATTNCVSTILPVNNALTMLGMWEEYFLQDRLELHCSEEGFPFMENLVIPAQCFLEPTAKDEEGDCS